MSQRKVEQTPLMVSILFVLQLAHAERDGVVAMSSPRRAGDRVKAELVGFLGIFTVGNDADRLALDVVEMGVSTAQVEGDVITRPMAPSCRRL